MAQPTTFTDLPIGIIRCSFSGARFVWMVDSSIPLAKNTEIMKLADTMLDGDKAKKYWVFSSVTSAHDKSGKTYTISLPNPHVVKSAGFNGYDNAEEQYEKWAKSDAGKSKVNKGVWYVGKED